MNIDNPAFDYDAAGYDYAGQRRTDPRIAAYVYEALGGARTVLNVGAGAGSYEPADRYVVAVEPSAVMRGQRARIGKMPALNVSAGALPFDDGAFDAVMAMVTVHHWPDKEKGLRELRRVAKNRVLILTFDPGALHLFWNERYFPELIEVERQRFPPTGLITRALGGACEIIPVPIPLDCADGFQEAFYGRPEAFLQKEVRQSQSAWGFLPCGLEKKLVRALAEDLASGEWDRKYGHYRTQPFFTGALRLIVASV
jgi:SAM-dependent methyltransferase